LVGLATFCYPKTLCKFEDETKWVG
jgi:hypothetical protein